MYATTTHVATAARIADREERVDGMIDDSFPASDPPATTGAHAGSPRHPREEAAAKAQAHTHGQDDDGLVDTAGWWFFIGGAATALLALILNAMVG